MRGRRGRGGGGGGGGGRHKESREERRQQQHLLRLPSEKVRHGKGGRGAKNLRGSKKPPCVRRAMCCGAARRRGRAGEGDEGQTRRGEGSHAVRTAGGNYTNNPSGPGN